jgi:hypothetical protein
MQRPGHEGSRAYPIVAEPGLEELTRIPVSLYLLATIPRRAVSGVGICCASGLHGD